MKILERLQSQKTRRPGIACYRVLLFLFRADRWIEITTYEGRKERRSKERRETTNKDRARKEREKDRNKGRLETKTEREIEMSSGIQRDVWRRRET